MPYVLGITDLENHLLDPARLAALYSVALLDTSSEEAFDRLSRLAARLLKAPVALVSLVDADRQFFKSCIGLQTEPWASDRETPLSHSFCQHNRVADQPLVVPDAREHPTFKDNLAIRDLDVIAYLGFPLATSDGHVLGSFCVIDNKPRDWEPEDIEIIRDLGAAVMVEIQLRTEIANRHQVEGERDQLTELNEQLLLEISARQQAEEQQRQLEDRLQQTRKIEAIGQLAGGIAHDLNNLLGPILIYTSILMKDDDLASNHVEMVDQIQDTGLRARDLIRQLLTFSRLQAMQMNVHDLNDIVDRVQTLLRRTTPADIEIVVNLADESLPVLADDNQIDQIVMNLVINAADAMPSGGNLHIETGQTILEARDLITNPEAEPGRFVRLTVSDDGKGMTPEVLQRVHEPFFSTKGTKGTGLGLATVMGIVMQHGGVIASTSELNVGTTFHVYLPVTDAPADHDVPAEAGARPSAEASETILIAEDAEALRDILPKILESHGYQVLSAKDGDEALSLLRYHEGPIHLLLTDVVMPGMNGRQLFEAARADRPGLRVLYMSGHSEDIISHRGVLDSGINFIAKPFTDDELAAKIDEALAPVRPRGSGAAG